MASKFGGDQAAKYQWVTQQNLARHKGMMSYVHKAKAPKPKAAKPAAPAEAAATEPSKTPAT